MATERSLPDFQRPPLVEVALAVQFPRVTGFASPHIGLLWNEFRDRFPRIEEHPPRPNMIEQFDLAAEQGPEVKIKVAGRPPLPLVWFLNEEGTQLIQLQPDRLVHNWRKTPATDEEYPRYESIRRHFAQELEILEGFLKREKLGEFKPNQIEVTYLNLIPSGQGWTTYADTGSVFRILARGGLQGLGKEPDGLSFSARRTLARDDDTPYGRLHVEIKTGRRRADDREVLALNLTVRGRPDSEDTAGALEFMDTGRSLIVNCFTEITTDEMHRIWGRTQ